MQSATYRESGYDMRRELTFPSAPKSKTDIWDPRYRGYLIACALTGRYDYLQYNVYRKFWLLMDEDSFRRVLERVRGVLATPGNSIRSSAAFLTSELQKELA